MSATVAIGDVQTPAQVLGVHGTTGVSYWKCLSRRLGLRGDWEAVEWACLPPGAVSGAHRHTRTEELYFIVSGRGRIAWECDAADVSAGDLIATPLGAWHELTNTGSEPLTWLVIEMSAAVQSAALAGAAARNEPPRTGVPVSLHVVHLRDVAYYDATRALDGPIREIRLVRLTPGQSLDLDASASEYTMFTVSGHGTALAGAATSALEPGVAVTLPLGTQVRAQATDDGELELFVARLAVEGEVVA
jgi:mannose-6-phosphate isomerase-like protein (cupin superfamily)